MHSCLSVQPRSDAYVHLKRNCKRSACVAANNRLAMKGAHATKKNLPHIKPSKSNPSNQNSHAERRGCICRHTRLLNSRKPCDSGVTGTSVAAPRARCRCRCRAPLI